MKKIYLAHTAAENGNKITCADCGKCVPGEERCHKLKEHLEDTAELAKEKANVFGAGEIAEVLGLCHDLGKYSSDFQDKLRGKTINAPHAMNGAMVFSSKYEKDNFAKYLAITIASHHTGLMNLGNEYDPDSFIGKSRGNLSSELPYHKEIALPESINHKKLLLEKSCFGFQVATYIRMLFSVLIDSDFTNTEEFCSKRKRDVNYDSILTLYEKLLMNIPQNDGTKINTIRAEILKNCMDKADQKKGIFTLTVPTGGGKTLSSLAFALKHAIKHNLRRVIYVVPYTTIIEQNAKIIKNILGENNVLEHHSNIQNEDTSNDFKYRWATENWDIPIVITTNVQFFESLFANKTSSLRKIHNITGSVIVFDEAQMLPTNYLSPCMSIVSELIKNYGCSAVLCSATQPALQKYVYKDIQAIEIAEDVEQLFIDLKRTEFIYLGKMSDEDIIDDIVHNNTSTLVVLNSKRHAFTMYNEAVKKYDDGCVFYLSTYLIPLHRTDKIKKIKDRLYKGELTIVISTQLIEAGVDIDFPIVYRSLAGIDSIIQAGGRANREGKLPIGKVKVFESSSENGKIPKILKYTADLGSGIIYSYKEKAFELEGVNKYFENYYKLSEQDGILDKNEILTQFQMNNGALTDCNFKTASENFKLIDDQTKSIVIECEASKEIIARLRSGNYQKNDMRKLQIYSINVYSQTLINLINDHAIENINGVYVLITKKYYDAEKGLDVFSDENKNGEAFVL